MTEPKDAFEQLRRPFAPNEIERLPKQLRKNDDNRGPCEDTPRGRQYSADRHFCGGFHARSLHLDYVGHAGITDRLNEVDPLWDYEFMHVDLPAWASAAVGALYQHGTPDAIAEAGRLVKLHGIPISRDGGYWIKLTILGHTRIGFGDAGAKSGANATKEVIGDALRNAAMRFGVGTYLWSKSDAALAKKQAEEVEHDDAPAAAPPAPPAPPAKPWDEAQADAAIKFALRTQQPEVALRKAWDDASATGSPQHILDRIRAAAPSQQQPTTEPYESEIVE
ncbi:hypothetical protein [Sinomonas susongensis]|uniref:hypothetical protein n=1 Tax=Sinomonas susongensis TaxID=1324851 RepID=UPI001107A835|nr:hypothetical protein [Sinomonas susongensis]